MQLLTVTCMLATAVAWLPPTRHVQPRRHALRAADDDAAALLEAANKLRAEAAALETEAKAEAGPRISARGTTESSGAGTGDRRRNAAAAGDDDLAPRRSPASMRRGRNSCPPLVP